MAISRDKRIMRVQVALGLEPDGIIGPITARSVLASEGNPRAAREWRELDLEDRSFVVKEAQRLALKHRWRV